MSDKSATIWGVISKCQTLMMLGGGLWLSMLLLPGTAQAAISYVQTVGSTSLTSSGTTMVVNVSSSVTAGNSIIVTMALDQSFGGALNCNDSQGNSYTTDLDVNNGIMRSVTCSAHDISALSTSDTITISHPSGWARAVSAHEFSGLSATATLDRTRYSGSFFSSFADSLNTLTTSQADELLIGNISVEGPISDGFTLGVGYAGVYRVGTSGGFPDRTVNAQYRIVSATGNYSSTGTLSPGSAWIASIVTYRAAASITISGSCRQVDQTTNCNDTGTVRVAVNGALQAQTQTTVAGIWAISGVTPPASGDVITVFIDAAADNREAVAVTRYDGTGDITGIELIEEHLTIGSDDNQLITNSDLAQYDNSVSGDEDIFHEVNASNSLTVDATGALTAEALYIKSGNTFRPDSGGTGSVITHDMEINGTFTADGNSINLNGSWDNNAIFNADTSTVNFTAGSGAETIDSSAASSAAFYNMSFNDAGGTATYQLGSALNVSNDLTVTDGILDTVSGSNYPINVSNDFLQPGGRVEARASTFTVGRHFTANGSETSGGYNNAHLVMNGTGLLTYNNLSAPWDNGFSGLTVGQSGNTTTLANHWLCVLDVLTVGSGSLVGSGTSTDIFLKGAPNPLSFDVASIINIDALNFHDNLTQNIPPLVNGYDSDIYLTRTNANVVQTGVITINAGNDLILNGDNFTDRAVTYNTNGFDLNVAGNIQIGAGNDTTLKTLNGTNSNITLGGDFNILDVGTGTQQALFIATNSTVTLNGTNQSISGSTTFYNLTKSVSSADTLTFTANSTQTIASGGTVTLNGVSGELLTLNCPGCTSDVDHWNLNISSGAFKNIDYVNVSDADASGSDASHTPINPANYSDGGSTISWFGINITGSCQQTDQTTSCTDTGTVRVAVNGVLRPQMQTTVGGVWAIGITPPASGDTITVFIDGAANIREAVAVTRYDGTGNITGVELIEEHLTIGSDDNQTISNADLGQYDNSVSGDEDVFHEVNGSNSLTVDTTGALVAEELYIKSGNAFRPDSTSAGSVTTHDLEINGTFIADGNSISLNGSWDNNAIFNAGSSTVNFTAVSGTETIDSNAASSASFYNISFNDAGGSAIFQLESALVVNNNLTITDGVLDTQNGSDYAINVSNDFLQSGGQVQARSATLTVARHFLADGNETNSGYNSAHLVMSGSGNLTYNNLSLPWSNGFFNLTAGQSGNTTTLLSNQMAVRNQLDIGAGTLGGVGTAHLYLHGAPDPLLVDTANTTIDIDELRFLVAGTKNLPALLNGYDATIKLAGPGVILNQTGAVTINAGNNLIIDGDSFVERTVTYNTGGFDLNVGGNIQLGAGNDTALKTLNGTNSIITIGGDLDILDIGTGTQQALFIAPNSSVIFNGINQSINGSTTFYNLIKSVSSADTLSFESNSTQTIASGGTVTLNGVSGELLTLNCPGCTSDVDHWNLNISSGAFKNIDYVNVSDADASGSDASHTPINPANYSDGGSTISWFGSAVITVLKMSAVITDPVNGGSNPKRIPAAVIEYMVVPSNSGVASPDANTVVITDAIDATNVAFDVTNGVSFTDGTTSSGLAMGVVTYSDTPAPGPYVYDYLPVAGYDGAVTSIRVTTTGSFNFGGSPDPSFTLRYRVQIK